MTRATLFVISLVGLALSASVLVLLLPPLIESGGAGRAWVAGGAAVLATARAIGTRWWGPPRP